MAIPNRVDLEFCTWMSEVKLLTNIIVFADILGSLLPHILPSNVTLCHNLVPNMFSAIYPGQEVPTEHHLSFQRSVLTQEGETPSFT